MTLLYFINGETEAQRPHNMFEVPPTGIRVGTQTQVCCCWVGPSPLANFWGNPWMPVARGGLGFSFPQTLIKHQLYTGP